MSHPEEAGTGWLEKNSKSVNITLCVINYQVIDAQVGQRPGHALSRQQGGQVSGWSQKKSPGLRTRRIGYQHQLC